MNIVVKSQFSNWKWKYNRCKTYAIPYGASADDDQTYTILSRNGTTLVSLNKNKLTINRHYHFNGADHAPDFRSGLEWYARHDAMIQLHKKYPAQITREMADEVLHPDQQGSPLHLWLYYPAVKLYTYFTNG